MIGNNREWVNLRDIREGSERDQIEELKKIIEANSGSY